MKVLAKLTVLAVLMGAMHPLLANEKNSLESLISVQEVEQGKVQLTYYGKTPEKLYVNIYNEDNQPVFKEIIRSKNGIKKPYNISQLPYGEYRFEVRIADELVTHTISYEAPLYPGNVKVVTKTLDDQKFRMMVMGPDYKDFRVALYNQQNQLLFEERVQQKDNFGKVFNLKATGEDTVWMVLSQGNNVIHSKTINL